MNVQDVEHKYVCKCLTPLLGSGGLCLSLGGYSHSYFPTGLRVTGSWESLNDICGRVQSNTSHCCLFHFIQRCSNSRLHVTLENCFALSNFHLFFYVRWTDITQARHTEKRQERSKTLYILGVWGGIWCLLTGDGSCDRKEWGLTLWAALRPFSVRCFRWKHVSWFFFFAMGRM